MSQHVALLGDSVFDNAAYTGGEPDVATHLGRMLPKPWRVTLLARDGATTAGIEAQVERLERSVSQLVVSVGGNDALGNLDMLDTRVASSGEALALFSKRIARFERSYREAIEAVRGRALPTTLCTIYNGKLPDARQAEHARMALMMFNDVILRTAGEHGLDVIELRSVCTDPRDYANPIEPSGRGGEKIARAILAALGLAPGARARSRLFF